MFKADGTRRDFPVTKSPVVVGRTNSCDLRIPLPSVSRQHCELRLDDEALTVRDLGSSNGTYRNNIRVQEATLEPGDEIVIGPVVFTVVVDGVPEEIKPVRTVIDESDVTSSSDESVPSEPVTDSSASAAPSKAEELPVDEDEDEMPEVEPEQHTPTVDLDDPIAALEKLSAGEDGDDEDDDALPVFDDEDDEEDFPDLSDENDDRK